MMPYIEDLEAEAPCSLRVVFPWPDKGLSPNARLHWAAKAAKTKKARADAHTATLAAAGMSLSAIRRSLGLESNIPLKVTFYPPDRRLRDDDSMVSSFKAARDGLADALGVNDRRFRAHYFFEDPCKPGRIEVEI